MACLVTAAAGRSAFASERWKGCARPFEPPHVNALKRRAAATANGWLLLFLDFFFSFEKADLLPAANHEPALPGFAPSVVSSPVLLPQVVQSKLGGMLGSDHANLPPIPTIAGASKQ